MGSSNRTISDSGDHFEADETQRTATMQTPGGIVSNLGSADAWINVDGGTVATSDPLGASGRKVPVGGSVALPKTCRIFTFKAAASPSNTYLVVEKPGSL